MSFRFLWIALVVATSNAHGEESPVFIPQFLGAQYTLVDQHQDAITSPYSGPLSLLAEGDSERSHTFGLYIGVPLPWHLQFYFDEEMFKGEPISGGTGLGGGANGDVVHAGANNLGKGPYAARHYLQYSLPIGDDAETLEAAQDQLPGSQATTRVEFKLGKFSVSDDFDKNRYANSARTQFLNVALVNNVAWDYAADTRGYTNGALVAYITPTWALRYGIFQMPAFANGQTLDWPLSTAKGEQLELTVQPDAKGWAMRLMVFQNTANMGIYRNAITIAEEQGTVPDIRADDHQGRHKSGYAANAEFPIADDGETGLFARLGHNDGHTESFAFTEADGTVKRAGTMPQISGAKWGRPSDDLSIGFAENAISPDHRDYLALGGSGFLLGDGRLNYARERIGEIYYHLHIVDHVELTPDYEFIHSPGYNRDRGPARFFAVRMHLEI